MEQHISTSTATSTDASKRGWSMLEDYCLKNPFLVLWNVALILGGLITFTHFASIHYFPDLDVKTASSFLLGIALLGVSLIAVLAVILVVPSYIIRSEIWRPYYLYHPAIVGREAERVSAAVEKSRRLPFVTLSLLHGLTAFFFWVFFASFFITDSFTLYKTVVRVVSVVGFILSVGALFFSERRWKQREPLSVSILVDRAGHSRRAQHFTLASVWWLFYPGYMLLLVLSIGKLDRNDLAGHFWILSFAISLIVVNTGLASTNFSSLRSYWRVPAMAALLTIFYLSIPSNPLSITRTVFTSLAIGDLGSSQFVVKRPTCDALNLMVPGSCEVASDTVGCIRPKSLANRIGGEYLVVLSVPLQSSATTKHVNDGEVRALEVRIPIPKSEVLVWGAVDANNFTWASCASAGKLPSESVTK